MAVVQVKWHSCYVSHGLLWRRRFRYFSIGAVASIAIEQTVWSKFKQKCSLGLFPWLGNFHNRFNGLVPGARRWINDGWDGKIPEIVLEIVTLRTVSFFRLVSERVLSSSLYMFTSLFGVEKKSNNEQWIAFKVPLHIKLGNVKLLDF